MYKDYSNFKAIDFIQDDFFVESIQHPTKDSELFWKKLILSEKIDSDELINAYQLLKELQLSRPEIDYNRVDALWLRILETNKAKQRKVGLRVYLKYAVAASVLLVMGLIQVLIINDHDIDVSEFYIAKDNSLHMHDKQSDILLITDDSIMQLKGEEVFLAYDQIGNIKVNEEKIKVNENLKNHTEYQTLIVPFGKRAFITLSDGTKLWVNTGTTVVFPVVFDEFKREIVVNGEVYADVFHDEAKPFIVKTSKLDIQVLGTKFNVSAYANDPYTNVILVEGSVNVIPENGKATVIAPNQMYSLTAEKTSLRNVDIDNYISWIDGVYIFKNEPIEDILTKLSRYYNVRIIMPSDPSGIFCSGKLELKEDLNELLNGLSDITSMSYGVQDGEYKVKFR
jgi:hypothetical protein